MTNTPTPHSPRLYLSDADVEEFRALVTQHAGATLTADEARSVSAQLLRVFAIVRSVALSSSNDSTAPVDEPSLPSLAN